MSGRDPLAEIIAYNRPLLEPAHLIEGAAGGELTAQALARKLDALASSPFAFLRGTFHLMAADVLQARVPHAEAHAPEALIVGDLHLENFGTYRGASGALCFDVNDFDDVGFGPADFDLKRLCTSALLLPGLSKAVRLATAKAVAKAWADGVERLGGRFPVPPWDRDKATGRVKDLLELKAKRLAAAQAAHLAKAAPDGRRFQEAGTPPKYVHVKPAVAKIAEAAAAEYLEVLDQLHQELAGKWAPIDVAYRFKGTGSLGRWRFSVLLARGDELRIVELKEALPSALDGARGRPPGSQRARVQAAAIRRLQGDPWPHVAGTHFGAVPALGREIQPEEEKLASVDFDTGKGEDREDLLEYARQCGEVLARLHVRESAPLLLAHTWSAAEAARAAVAFAEAYAPQVEADQRAFVAARERVAAGLRVQ